MVRGAVWRSADQGDWEGLVDRVGNVRRHLLSGSTLGGGALEALVCGVVKVPCDGFHAALAGRRRYRGLHPRHLACDVVVVMRIFD